MSTPLSGRPERLGAAAARRLALGAQGLARPPAPGEAAHRGHVRRLVERLGAVQLDSVNVVARAHLLPLRSRLGGYDRAVLDAALGGGRRAAWEYWAHEASLVPAAVLAALRWRMAEAERRAWRSMSSLARRRPELLDRIVEALAGGPLTGRELQRLLEPAGHRPTDHWGWNWTDVKRGVEYLFWSGAVTSAGRTAQFERRYDLPARVWPAEALHGPVPDADDAVRVLVERAARACGVATEADLRDYFRLPAARVRPAVADLVDSGTLAPVLVEGWDRPAWRHQAVPLPRRADAARTLLAPFDPLVWHRDRAERLFGFRYRLEIYVPAHRRVHGYYVLPFLHRDRLVARVDLKADRELGELVVRSAWAERDITAEDVEALTLELAEFATWLGLTGVRHPVPGTGTGETAGDLAPALRGTLSP